MLHDCFGTILLVKEGVVTFLCGECGKPTGKLDAEGFHSISKHPGGKHPNRIALQALKIAIAQVEKKG